MACLRRHYEVRPSPNGLSTISVLIGKDLRFHTDVAAGRETSILWWFPPQPLLLVGCACLIARPMASTVLMLKSRSWIFLWYNLTFSTANSCFANGKITPSPMVVCVPYNTAARHQQLTQGLLQGLPDLAAINEWLKMVLANKHIAV